MHRHRGKTFAFIGFAVVVALGRPACAQVVTEFPDGISAGAELRGIALGADKNLWFVERAGNRVGRITPQGAVTEFTAGISAGADPRDIALGPDGNLWFTEFGASQIGRITPAGVVTEFGQGITPSAQPLSIAAGPDGNLWFTEINDRIGRITPQGVITEFSAGITSDALPTGIARGPDGNMWFAEEGTNRIGRITPAGVVTEFSTGITPVAVLIGVAAGPDGNVWFTEYGVHRIGRITPAGVVTEFGSGISAGSNPQSIVAGPDGNLWFTERTGNRIGRITPSGVVTEFESGISTGGRPYGIAAGAGPALWFTEELGSRVGKISTGAPPTLTVEFGAAAIALNGSTSKTYTLRNPNERTALTHVTVTDGLPAGLAFAVPARVTGSCGNGALAAGESVVSLYDGSLAPGGSCTFSVSVTGIATGTFTDTTGDVTSLEGGNGGTATATLTVQGSAPAITSPPTATLQVGVDGSYTVTTTGAPVPTIAVLGALPPGVSFRDNRDGTGMFFGKPAAGSAGSYPVQITATNGAGPSAAQNFILNVVTPAANALEITVEPSRPTATDDIVVRSLVAGGCRLLSSPFQQTPSGALSGLLFATAEPTGCPSGNAPLEARIPLAVPGPGSYHVVLWKITGGAPPTPSTPESKAEADVFVGDAEWLIPATARADGVNGAHWTTNLEIFSTNASEAEVTLTFLASGGAPANAPSASVVVPAFGAVRLEDVLFTSLGLTQATGAIVATSRTAALRFVPSIGTNFGTGRIAQLVPAVPGRAKLRPGRPGVLYGIEEDGGARTNLALANAGAAPAEVDLSISAPGTSPDATMRVTVPPRGMLQVNRVVRALGIATPVSGARLTVTPFEADDGVAALATVIDNVTNSPRTVTPE